MIDPTVNIRTGLLASGALLIEKKGRRAELALYTLPRAVDSLFLALTERRWVPSLRFGVLSTNSSSINWKQLVLQSMVPHWLQ